MSKSKFIKKNKQKNDLNSYKVVSLHTNYRLYVNPMWQDVTYIEPTPKHWEAYKTDTK